MKKISTTWYQRRINKSYLHCSAGRCFPVTLCWPLPLRLSQMLASHPHPEEEGRGGPPVGSPPGRVTGSWRLALLLCRWGSGGWTGGMKWGPGPWAGWGELWGIGQGQAGLGWLWSPDRPFTPFPLERLALASTRNTFSLGNKSTEFRPF